MQERTFLQKLLGQCRAANWSGHERLIEMIEQTLAGTRSMHGADSARPAEDASNPAIDLRPDQE